MPAVGNECRGSKVTSEKAWSGEAKGDERGGPKCGTAQSAAPGEAYRGGRDRQRQPGGGRGNCQAPESRSRAQHTCKCKQQALRLFPSARSPGARSNPEALPTFGSETLARGRARLPGLDVQS